MRARLPFFTLALLVLLLDQLTKQLIVGLYGLTAGWIDAPLPFMNLVLVWNRGISFGMFADHPEWMPWILLGMTSLMTLVLAIWLWRTPRKVTQIGLSLVIGGAIGNIIDRLQYGAVVDFLDFHLGGYHWPAFNVADSTIFIGVVFLLWDSVLEAKENKN